MNGEHYRGANLRSGRSMRHESQPPARAINGTVAMSAVVIWVIERIALGELVAKFRASGHPGNALSFPRACNGFLARTRTERAEARSRTVRLKHLRALPGHREPAG